MLTAPRKLHTFLMMCGGSCTRMAEMCFFHGLRPVGVNQYPSQLVTWMAQAHLRELTVKSFTLRQDKTKSKRIRRFSQLLPKTPMSSMSPWRTCFMIYCAKSGAHLRPMDRCLCFYFPKGVIITHSSWDSSSILKV